MAYADGLAQSLRYSGSRGMELILDVLVPKEVGARQRKKPKKHGPRGSRPKEAVILSFNSPGEPQLRSARQELQQKKSEETPERIEVVAVCCQEHHAAGTKWADLQHARPARKRAQRLQRSSHRGKKAHRIGAAGRPRVL